MDKKDIYSASKIDKHFLSVLRFQIEREIENEKGDTKTECNDTSSLPIAKEKSIVNDAHNEMSTPKANKQDVGIREQIKNALSILENIRLYSEHDYDPETDNEVDIIIKNSDILENKNNEIKYRLSSMLNYLNDHSVENNSASSANFELVDSLKEQLAKANNTISELNAKNTDLQKQIEGLNENSTEDSAKYGKKLNTGDVIYLIHYAKLNVGNCTSQEWAAALHLLTGCSINTLRQKFNKKDHLTEAAKEKVRKLYDDTLKELKNKAK